MSGVAVQRFDLHARAAQDLRYRRTQRIVLTGFGCVFMVLGVWGFVGGLLLLPLSASRFFILLVCAPILAATGAWVALFFTWGFRNAVEAVVDPDGVTWVPSRGKPTRTDWSNPRLQARIIDWRVNSRRPAVMGGPDDIAMAGPGLFSKLLTAQCYDAIVQSARARGLAFDEGIQQPGTRYERRVIVITRAR
jgi:hypothetical protein